MGSLEINSNVSLSFLPSSLKKKRQTGSKCASLKNEFTSVCKNTTDLTECNSSGLNSFLNDYTTQSVSLYDLSNLY